jgi:hypothetical protein
MNLLWQLDDKHESIDTGPVLLLLNDVLRQGNPSMITFVQFSRPSVSTWMYLMTLSMPLFAARGWHDWAFTYRFMFAITWSEAPAPMTNGGELRRNAGQRGCGGFSVQQ